MKAVNSHGWRVIIVLFLLLPFFLSSSTYFMLGWLLSGILIFIAWSFFNFSREPVQRRPQQEPRMLHEEEQPESVREVMNVSIAIEKSGIQIFRGKLREAASQVYEKLKHSFGGNTVPLVQEDEELGAAILLMPRPIEQATMEKPVRIWLHCLLFFLTFLTTTWIGAMQQGVNLITDPSMFPIGLQYSLGLLAILGVHEFGHYFMARHHQMQVTPPYFIPVPFALGTFGAFIQMRSPAENRKSLFDVAVAGPLAGLMVAIPALIMGLHSSTIISNDSHNNSSGTPVGSSILLALLVKLSLGSQLHSGHLVQLSPLAYAGWLGLFITALNLIPVGQLDGGHIIRSMFGNRRGVAISKITLWIMFILTLFLWPGLLMWMIILFLIAAHTTPPLNDITSLGSGRFILGILAFFILSVILLPLPRSLWQYLQINQPFL
jgi:Zn-dependent protease